MITVAIAEDHQALIDGIMSYVKNEADIEIVGCAKDGLELIDVVRKKRPMVVLCDIRMPKLDGVESTRIITAQFPKTKVIAFTMFDQDKAIRQMLAAGVYGYVLKNSGLSVVLEAIRAVAGGERFYDSKIHLPSSQTNNSKSLLSCREHEILQLISQGKTSHEIAGQLFIGKSTVDTHRKNMTRKLGLSGAGELLRYAVGKKYEF